MPKFRPTLFFFDPCQNFMDPRHPRQNSDPRHPRHFFDPYQNFMGPRHPRHPWIHVPTLPTPPTLFSRLPSVQYETDDVLHDILMRIFLSTSTVFLAMFFFISVLPDILRLSSDSAIIGKPHNIRASSKGMIFQLIFGWKLLSNQQIIWLYLISIFPLTHFMPLVPFYAPWKQQKARAFLNFSGAIRRDQWHVMG